MSFSTGNPVTEPPQGYLSEESKRRFTLVAGVLGAVFFLAQFLLPMLVMFLVMMPMMMSQAVSIGDLDHAVLWREGLWLIEQKPRLNWRDLENSAIELTLKQVRLADLADVGPAFPLGTLGDSSPALLPVGDRLWVIGTDTNAYFERGSLTRLSDSSQRGRASRPFVYGGRPAIISLGTRPTLATLQAEGARAEWTARDLPLRLPAEAGALRALEAVEAGERLYLFVQVCTEAPDRCSLYYRQLEQDRWLPLVEDLCSCVNWTALALGSSPAVAFSEREKGHASRVKLVTVTPNGTRGQQIELEGRLALPRWHALAVGNRILLLSEGFPGSLRLKELADGRVISSVRKRGSFPFGPQMMPLMMIPQLLPILLSLTLALLLTIEMRRHRVQDYVSAGARRRFASLWQRALAQLVDLVPFLAGFLLTLAPMWRFFSDPENLLESGPSQAFWVFGLCMAAAFVWGLLVLTSYSYLEGRFGKTPGKWLLGIRVLGTDLHPCGFGRAFLRNLLTFVDGFFNFLVGVLLVALTENWQRLGDLAARTIVVVDEKSA